MDDLHNQFISGEEELKLLSNTPKIITDKLKIGNRFYLGYYSKLSNFYLDEYNTIFEDTKNKLNNIKENVEKMREIKSNKRDTFIYFSIGFIALFLVIVQIYLHHISERKNDRQFNYFQRKLNEIINALNRNRRR